MKNAIEWECKYCKLKVFGRQKLLQHYKTCNIKNSLPKDSLGRVKTDNGKAAAETKHRLGIKGKPHKCSEETKKKISESQKKAFREGRNKPWINPSMH